MTIRHRIRGAGLMRRLRSLRRRAEEGIATAEYAIVMVAAAALAGVLLIVVRSPFVREMIESLIRRALEAG